LIDAIKEMDGAENEIEAVPVLLDPPAPCHGVHGIVVQLDPGADFHIRIRGAQPGDFVEIDSFVVTIVIGEGNVG
jgi:hypothetical protein